MSNKDAIEKIKRDGAIHALKERIQRIEFQLSQVWEATEQNGKFVKLGTSIAMARELLDMMSETMEALAELEPGNK